MSARRSARWCRSAPAGEARGAVAVLSPASRSEPPLRRHLARRTERQAATVALRVPGLTPSTRAASPVACARLRARGARRSARRAAVPPRGDHHRRTTRTGRAIVHESRRRDVVFVDTLPHHTHSVMLRKQMHSDSQARSLHHGAPRREGRSMDRMLVEAATAATTPPERPEAGVRFPAVMLSCIAGGKPRARRFRFPAVQAARWRRRGEPVQREMAWRFRTSAERSSCT